MFFSGGHLTAAPTKFWGSHNGISHFSQHQTLHSLLIKLTKCICVEKYEWIKTSVTNTSTHIWTRTIKNFNVFQDIILARVTSCKMKHMENVYISPFPKTRVYNKVNCLIPTHKLLCYGFWLMLMTAPLGAFSEGKGIWRGREARI